MMAGVVPWQTFPPCARHAGARATLSKEDKVEKHTIEEIRDIVDSEGLGYAVTSYMASTEIKDEELASLWRTASDALEKIERILFIEH